MHNESDRGGKRRRTLWTMACLLFTVLVVAAGVVYGGQRGTWPGSGYRVLNLESRPVEMEARIYGLDGTMIYQRTETIAGQQGGCFVPEEEGLPPGQKGMFWLEANGQVAAAIVHFAQWNLYDWGTEIFEVVPEESLTPRAYFPVDWCTQLAIHNPAATPMHIQLTIYYPTGEGIRWESAVVSPSVTIPYSPAMELDLWPAFRGSGMIEADQPVLVTVSQRRNCDRLSAYVAPGQGAHDLAMPLVWPDEPQVTSSTLKILNTSNMTADLFVGFSNGMTKTRYLPPFGSFDMDSPLYGEPSSAIAYSSQPLVIVVSRESTDGISSWAYRAFDIAQATPKAALPLIWQGYGGWFTKEAWVQNLGPEMATATAYYMTVPTGTLQTTSSNIPPGEAWPLYVPPLDGSRAAAWVEADQPIVAVAPAMNYDFWWADQYMLCRGVNYFAPPPPSHVIYLPLVIKARP